MLGEMTPAKTMSSGSMVLQCLIGYTRIILILLKNIDYQVLLPRFQLSKSRVKSYVFKKLSGNSDFQPGLRIVSRICSIPMD